MPVRFINRSLRSSIFYGIIILFFAASACESKKELTVKDFKFDGPMGSEGASIEKIDKNVFNVKLGHAPNQPD